LDTIVAGKNNNLPAAMIPGGSWPAAKSLDQCNKEGFLVPGSKRQASSSSFKLQASSSKRQAATCTNKKKDIDINHE
jgi:hypothetical protein